MLSYKNFIQELKESFLEFFPEEYQECKVELIEKYTRNGKHDGIILRRPDDTNTPVLYLDHYYKEMYENHLPMVQVMEKISSDYQKALTKGKALPVPQYSNPRAMQKNLFAQAINFERNQELLKTVPYLQMNDLAIIPRMKLAEGCSMEVTSSLCRYLGGDEDTILAEAIKNNIEVTKPSLSPIGDVIMEILGEEPERNKEMIEEIRSNPVPMYVLTNKDKVFGASLIANKQLLDAIGKAMGQDYFILPSSVHELLLFPQSEAPDVEELKAVVMEVNRTQLKPEEFLSDNVYFYDGKNREVQMYSGTMEREKVQMRHDPKKITQR